MDLHLKGLIRMGASINLDHGFVHATTEGLRGGRIYLDFPSVGATENLMMAAACARGESLIENAAREPEIMNLAEALKAMGVPVEGEGTGTIHVQGIDNPGSADVRIIPDRIEASTFLVAGVLTDGDVRVDHVIPDHLEALLAKLEEAGAGLEVGQDFVRAFRKGPLKGLSLKTLPYPGFPTDMQPQMMVLMCLAEGASVIQETVFEARLLHVGELKRMGANIELQGNTCVVAGVPGLAGADVRATDLRAGAALVLAGLVARGKTEITEVHHLWRGYEGFVDKIRRLGGKIRLEEEL
jgi:UDP-N-acetylglucosamine 1-carboxyvinyltransferase